MEDFHFYISVPGFRADYRQVDWEELKKSIEPVDLETDEELFEMLQEPALLHDPSGRLGLGRPAESRDHQLPSAASCPSFAPAGTRRSF